MGEHTFEDAKSAILEHIQEVFEEMEQEMALSHQEKYAMLEDLLHSATEPDELKLAYIQWYTDHQEEIEFEQGVNELWKQAMLRLDEEE